jgi:hypothetical protein
MLKTGGEQIIWVGTVFPLISCKFLKYDIYNYQKVTITFSKQKSEKTAKKFFVEKSKQVIFVFSPCS